MPVVVRSRESGVAAGAPGPSSAMWLDVEDKAKSELDLERFPALRALSSKQQEAALVYMNGQPRRPRKRTRLPQVRCLR